MSKKITCINDKGISVSFDYDDAPFFLAECDGIYTVSNNVNRTQNSYTDGSTYQGSNAKERNIVITAEMYEDYQKKRNLLYSCFKKGSEGTFLYEEDEEIRQIEYYVEEIDIEEKGIVRTATISLICPAPDFKDPYYTAIPMATWEAGFEWIHEFSADGDEVGTRTIEKIKDIENGSSTDEVGMIIIIDAMDEVINPIIRNLTTGEHVKFNITLKSGDVIRFCSETNKKNAVLIRDGEETDINGLMSEDSEYIMLEAGTNTLQYDAESGVDDINVEIHFKQTYVGV